MPNEDVRWCSVCQCAVSGQSASEGGGCPRCDAADYQVWAWDLVRTLCTCSVLLPEHPRLGLRYGLDKSTCAQSMVPELCPCPKRRSDSAGSVGCGHVSTRGVSYRCERDKRRVPGTAGGGADA